MRCRCNSVDCRARFQLQNLHSACSSLKSESLNFLKECATSQLIGQPHLDMILDSGMVITINKAVVNVQFCWNSQFCIGVRIIECRIRIIVCQNWCTDHHVVRVYDDRHKIDIYIKCHHLITPTRVRSPPRNHLTEFSAKNNPAPKTALYLYLSQTTIISI